MSTAEQHQDPYALAGVNYEEMDPFKRAAQQAALRTAGELSAHGAEELTWSRGESAYLIKLPWGGKAMGIVEEGLGTKNLVADKMRGLIGRTYYESIAQDTVAMIVNDLVTLGVPPWVVMMHAAAGSSDWFADADRMRDLVDGWAAACRRAGASWGGGESPTLKGVVLPNGPAVLSGSAVGFAPSEHILDPRNIHDGDAIVLCVSNGIHANGLSLARQVADQLPQGYQTLCSDGRMFGEALLDPTHIYASVLNNIRRQIALRFPPAALRYGINITGHGLRKLMRATQSFEYFIEKLPNPQPVFDLLRQHGKPGGMSVREMYSTFNMGVGFAWIVHPEYADIVVEASEEAGIPAAVAGTVCTSEVRRVVLEPVDITYEAKELQIR